MRNVKRTLGTAAVVAVVVGLALSTGVFAATATTNLSVTASVANNCTISTTAVAFGAYDPIVANATTDLDGTGGVTITCTKGATTTIGLDNGAHYLAPSRRMTDGTDNLNYYLYKESGRTQEWKNSGADLLTPPVAPSKAPRTYTVYGRVTAGQDVESGSYADTVVATVNF